jgi:hypothetical protein
MALHRLANLSDDVSELMNEEDEILWWEAGLIKNIVSSEALPIDFSSALKLSAYEGCRLSRASRVPLSALPVVLPGLEDSILEVPKVCSEFIPQSGFRGGVLSGSRGEPKKLTTLRKSRRQWSSNKVVKKMVLGSDVGLEDTCRLALCRLVGRFAYGNMCKEKLPAWMERVWVPVLGYNPELIYLTKGWLGFICRSPEDVELLLKSRWVNGGSSLMLKKWRVAFDPETEFFSYRSLLDTSTWPASLSLE